MEHQEFLHLGLDDSGLNKYLILFINFDYECVGYEYKIMTRTPSELSQFHSSSFNPQVRDNLVYDNINNLTHDNLFFKYAIAKEDKLLLNQLLSISLEDKIFMLFLQYANEAKKLDFIINYIIADDLKLSAAKKQQYINLALIYAIELKNIPVIDRLLAASIKPDNFTNALEHAVKTSNIAIVNKILATIPDGVAITNLVDIIMTTARSYSFEVVTRLLEILSAADIEHMLTQGYGNILFGLCKRNKPIVTFLLNKNLINLSNKTGTDGLTPIENMLAESNIEALTTILAMEEDLQAAHVIRANDRARFWKSAAAIAAFDEETNKRAPKLIKAAVLPRVPKGPAESAVIQVAVPPPVPVEEPQADLAVIEVPPPVPVEEPQADLAVIEVPPPVPKRPAEPVVTQAPVPERPAEPVVIQAPVLVLVEPPAEPAVINTTLQPLVQKPDPEPVKTDLKPTAKGSTPTTNQASITVTLVKVGSVICGIIAVAGMITIFVSQVGVVAAGITAAVAGAAVGIGFYAAYRGFAKTAATAGLDKPNLAPAPAGAS